MRMTEEQSYMWGGEASTKALDIYAVAGEKENSHEGCVDDASDLALIGARVDGYARPRELTGSLIYPTKILGTPAGKKLLSNF
jgi:hypothetical protein